MKTAVQFFIFLQLREQKLEQFVLDMLGQVNQSAFLLNFYKLVQLLKSAFMDLQAHFALYTPRAECSVSLHHVLSIVKQGRCPQIRETRRGSDLSLKQSFLHCWLFFNFLYLKVFALLNAFLFFGRFIIAGNLAVHFHLTYSKFVWLILLQFCSLLAILTKHYCLLFLNSLN